MTCSLARSLLDDYIDRELLVSTQSALKEHLKVCSACRAEYDELFSLRSALSNLRRPEPPQEYWGEVTELILARTVEADRPTVILTDSGIKARDRSSFYRSLLALAASMAIFATSLWLGSSGPVGLPAFSERGYSDSDRSSQLATTSPASCTISAEEQALIASGMLLVGTPGMFASPTEMSGLLGLNRVR